MIKIKKTFGHVRKQVGFRRTSENFGRPMSDDRLLVAALFILSVSLL